METSGLDDYKALHGSSRIDTVAYGLEMTFDGYTFPTDSLWRTTIVCYVQLSWLDKINILWVIYF